MLTLEPGFVLAVPAGFGVAFLLWALWNFWRDERRKSDYSRPRTSTANSVRVIRH
jgi:hypothetical protein